MIYKLQNGGIIKLQNAWTTIPLGGDYLEQLQNTPEVSGGSIQPAVKTEKLPEKFHGSQQAARTYAEGYQKGAKPVTKAIGNAGQKIFNTTKNVAMFIPGPTGAITWLGQTGADMANGEYGKVARDLALAAGIGAGIKAVGYITNNAIKPLIVARNIKVKHPELIRQISSNSDHIQALIKVWNNNTGQSIQYSPKLVENARKVNSALLYGKDPILESAASLSGFNSKTLSRLGIDKNVIDAVKGRNQTSKKLLAAKNLPENVTLYTSNGPKQLKYLGHGQEHEVYRDGENVIKFRFHRNPISYSPHNLNYSTLTDEFTSTGAYRYKKQGSEFIPERKYLGVGIDDGGSLVPVFEESFIEGKIPTQLELNEVFAKNGIKYDGVKQVTFKDGSTALDINPKNVLLVDGKPIIIDPITESMYNPNSRYYKFKPREVVAGSRPITIAEKAGISKDKRKMFDWDQIEALRPRFNKWAEYYGYDQIPESIGLENAVDIMKNTFKRHNTFFRGVHKPGTPEDIAHIESLFGKDYNLDDVYKYVATHGRPGDNAVFVSPLSNAGIYGSTGKTAIVRRRFKLGRNPETWLQDADFDIIFGGSPEAIKVAQEKNTFTFPWSQRGNGIVENELLAPDGTINFIDFVPSNASTSYFDSNGSLNKYLGYKSFGDVYGFGDYNHFTDIPVEKPKFKQGGKI